MCEAVHGRLDARALSSTTVGDLLSLIMHQHRERSAEAAALLDVFGQLCRE